MQYHSCTQQTQETNNMSENAKTLNGNAISAEHYEKAGDDLFARGEYESSIRAFRHAMNDLATPSITDLEAYKRVHRKCNLAETMADAEE